MRPNIKITVKILRNVLDSICLSYRSLLRSRSGSYSHYMYGRPCGHGGAQGQILVRTFLSARQSLRQACKPLFASQAHSCVCAQQGIPHLHALLYLRHVRVADEYERSYNGRDRPHILEYNPIDNHCRCSARIHICTAYMVYILPHGYALGMGGSPQSQEGFPCSCCFVGLPCEMPFLRQDVSYAARAMRFARRRKGLSPPRLHQMRAMCKSLPYRGGEHEKRITLPLFALPLTQIF